MLKNKKKKVFQDYVPRPFQENPLFELKSPEDLPLSDLYKAEAFGKEYRVTCNTFFHFVKVVCKKEELVEIQVEILKPFEKIDVKPRSLASTCEILGNKVTARLMPGERVVLELDEDLETPLYIMAEKYIPRPERVTHDYKAGNAYNIGFTTLHSGDVVYIEEGAVVSGSFRTRIASDIKIIGNGIMYGGNWHPEYENSPLSMIVPVLTDHVEIRGITLLDGGSWHLVPVACNDVKITDVSILGKVITGDGLDIVGSKDVHISNCFIRANDDCISIKGGEFSDPSGCTNTQNVLVENCLFWNAQFGNVLEIGYETRCREISNVVFRDSTILHCEYEGNQSGGVLTIHNADRAHVHDIHYENIVVEDAEEKFIDIKTLDSKYSTDRVRGMVNDIYFKNISITEGEFPPSIIRGYEMRDGAYRIHDIYFDNVTVHGEKVKDIYSLRLIKELTDDVHFL